MNLASMDTTVDVKCVAAMEKCSEPEKKCRKSFIDLGDRMRKDRTDDLVKSINDFIQKECTELSITQLLESVMKFSQRQRIIVKH